MWNPEVQRASEQAVEYIVSRQAEDGHWEDYALPVGQADAWITGYVGWTLSCLPPQQRLPASSLAIEKAARWINETRHYARGWGYNQHTGPDADSTAFALRLLRSVRAEERTAADEGWLTSMWTPDGGVATYERADAWGLAHPDVTAVAFLALPDSHRKALRSAFTDYLLRTRHSDGTWPSYWWRSSYYATFRVALAICELDLPLALPSPVVDERPTHSVRTNFDLACITGIAALVNRDTAQSLGSVLIELQRPDGGWTGGADLRVTDPSCRDPWVHAQGRLFADESGLITTATAVQALALLG